MTEITENTASLPEPIERFVLHWGEMGEVWGVNRSVAQIHALLFVADAPMTAEAISQALSLARSNVSTSLKELTQWNLVRRVPVMGDRREHFEAEADMFEMIRRIALGRKSREIDPALAVLRDCVSMAGDDKRVSAKARDRLRQMLETVEVADRAFSEIIVLPGPVLMRLMKMGSTLARFAGGRSRQKSPSPSASPSRKK